MEVGDRYVERKAKTCSSPRLRSLRSPSKSMESTSQFPATAKRDTPTCCALDGSSHTLFVGGSAGEVVAYDLRVLKDRLLAWQGVDETGKSPGRYFPKYVKHSPPALLSSREALTRLVGRVQTSHLVSRPREGKARVTERKPDEEQIFESLMKKTDDLSIDISSDLDWGRDVITGETLAPKFDSIIVIRKFSWVAHADTIKSLELIQVLHSSLPPRLLHVDCRRVGCSRSTSPERVC